MGRIHINEANMVYLRLAINLAGGTMKPPLNYHERDAKQRQQLADHIGIDLKR